MARSAWAIAAQKISKLMRKDLVKVYKSVPRPNSIGEWIDSLVLIGQYKANVTTPTESIVEEFPGTVRGVPYQITLDPDVPLPKEEKIYVELVKVRQGRVGAFLEVQSVQGGLLGYTLSADDEKDIG